MWQRKKEKHPPSDFGLMSKATISSHFTPGRHLPCRSEMAGLQMFSKATSVGVCDDLLTLTPMQTLGPYCGKLVGKNMSACFSFWASKSNWGDSLAVKVRICPSSLQILGRRNWLCGWQTLRTEGCESHSKPNHALSSAPCSPLELVQSWALYLPKDATFPFLFYYSFSFKSTF